MESLTAHVMTIPAALLRKAAIIIVPIAVGAVILDTFEPEGNMGHLLHILALPVLITIAATGGILACVERGGFIRLLFTDDEKRGFQYRMAKRLAQREYNQGLRYSQHYYDNYGITPENRNWSDDHAA